LGDAPREAGALDDLDDALDVLVGERRLLGKALVRRRANDDALGLELPPQLCTLHLLPGPCP
jgi:hypothetical protein